MKSIVDAFDLPASEIDEILDFGEADEFDGLKRSFLADPEGFARKALAKKPSTSAATNSILEKAQESRGQQQPVSHRPKRTKQTTRTMGAVPKTLLPNTDFAKELEGFEERANSAFEDLLDRGEETLAFEAFPYFVGELDQLARCFTDLFSHYRNHPQRTLDIIEERFLDSFLVFTADRARELFDGENLWGNLFDEIGLSSSAAQSEYKNLFVKGVGHRGLSLLFRAFKKS